jgi:TonB-dependent starch-binding outer membrane protein SusC
LLKPLIMTINRLLARIASFAICVLLTQFAFSQNKMITGKVSDDKGNPVLGATVAAKGSKTGAATDVNGAFKISVGPGITTLVITSVGFGKQEIDISGKTDVSVSLVTTNASLNEVVVIGYGTARRKDLTGSLTTVSSKEFNSGVITSPDQLLQNKVAGLEIINNSGQPGSETTIKIRGNSSIRGVQNPLYVVDGVPLDGRNARPTLTLNNGGFGTTPDVNPLIYINPYDIQDITILKDASSTAIYGSRGANGVIVITTRKASSGPLKMEVGLSEGWNVGYMKKFDVLDASEFRSALHKYSLDTLSTSLDKGSSVDALNEITQHTTIQNYNVAFSGGNDVGKFRASFLASKTPGFIKTNELDKYIGTFGGSYKFLDKKLTIDFGLIAAHTNERIVLVSNTAGSQGNLISAALQWNPTAPLTDANGIYTHPGNGVGNPLELIAANNDQAFVNTYLGNISASYKILKNLEYKLLYSINQSDGTRASNIAGFLQGFPPITGAGQGIFSTASLTSQVIDNTLNYRTNLNPNLTLEALLGTEYQKANYSNNSFGALGFNFNNSQTAQINAQYTDVLYNGNSQFIPSVFKDITTEIQSYFARLNLNYKDKYYLTGTFRADGSSKFGANNKYGYFPSFGAKWNIANEDMMKDNNTVSALAIRATWGITGSQDFQAGSSIDQFAFGTYNSASQINVGNPNLKWEQTTQYDIGLDFGILKDKIRASVDFYNKNTTDILFQTTVIQPGPPAQEWLNLPGHLINKGVEITLNAALVEHKDFTWDLGFNIAFNSGKLTDFYAPGTTNPLVINTGQINGQGVSGTLGQIITNNQPIDEFYLKPFQGYDQSGNQQIGPNPQFAGDPNPHMLFGGTTTLRYKKLSLTINGGGSAEFLIYNNTATSVTNLSGIAQGRDVDKNAYNSAERPSSGVGASSRFLENGNYFKLRNASLNYTIGNIGNYIKNMTVYVAGSNLFVITKFSGFDPEVNINKSNGGYGSTSIEYIPYPTPRSMVVGLNFSL